MYTNETPNYELPQWVGTDKPTFLGDMNGAYLKIDTALKANEVQAQDAITTATTAQNTAGTAVESSQINAQAIVQLNNMLANANANLNALKAFLSSTEINCTAYAPNVSDGGARLLLNGVEFKLLTSLLKTIQPWGETTPIPSTTRIFVPLFTAPGKILNAPSAITSAMPHLGRLIRVYGTENENEMVDAWLLTYWYDGSKTIFGLTLPSSVAQDALFTFGNFTYVNPVPIV